MSKYVDRSTVGNVPVHESIEVLAAKVIYKTPRWWSAVTLQINRGRLEVCQYLWTNTKGKWVRKQKAVFRDRSQWEVAKGAIDAFLADIESGKYDKKVEEHRAAHKEDSEKEEDE